LSTFHDLTLVSAERDSALADEQFGGTRCHVNSVNAGAHDSHSLLFSNDWNMQLNLIRSRCFDNRGALVDSHEQIVQRIINHRKLALFGKPQVSAGVQQHLNLATQAGGDDVTRSQVILASQQSRLLAGAFDGDFPSHRVDAAGLSRNSEALAILSVREGRERNQRYQRHKCLEHVDGEFHSGASYKN